MAHYKTTFISGQQHEAQDRNLSARHFKYAEQDENEQMLKTKKLWIAGESNRFLKDSHDVGNMRLGMEGSLVNKNIITNLSGKVSAVGVYPPEQAQSFALRDKGFHYGFETEKELEDGQKIKTRVIAASLTDKKNPTQRASFIRLYNEDNSFINKIYTDDGRVIEARFSSKGEAPTHISVDFDSQDNKYQTDWIDLSTKEGKADAAEALGAGQDRNAQNDYAAESLEDFCQYVNLHPEAVLFRLGLREKNQIETKQSDKPQNYIAPNEED